MREREISNVVIESTNLGFHDGFNSIPTAYLHCKGDGWGQGFGGYGFGGVFTHAFIYGVLKTLECESWEKLKGMHVRIDHDFGKVYRIGHILKDKWYDPRDDAP